MAILKIQQALRHLKKGGLVIVMDDQDREAEGDLVGLASRATPQKVLSMRGGCCVCLWHLKWPGGSSLNR